MYEHLTALRDELNAILAPHPVATAPPLPAIEPVAEAPHPVPAPAPPAVHVDLPNIGGVAVIVDPIVPSGTPGTVTLPKTGHVLSVPKPEAGEGILGYAVRVSKQAHGDPTTAGGLLVMQSSSPSPDWPTVVDYFYNLQAYSDNPNAPPLIAPTPATPPQPEADWWSWIWTNQSRSSEAGEVLKWTAANQIAADGTVGVLTPAQQAVAAKYRSLTTDTQRYHFLHDISQQIHNVVSNRLACNVSADDYRRMEDACLADGKNWFSL